MSISKEELYSNVKTTGFRPEIYEKVWILMDILNDINNHPYLKGRLALKGGTALNLFVFNLPRLSVDIDLNYIGGESREKMLEERPKIEEALRLVCEGRGLNLVHVPGYHSGGKFELRYDSALGHGGNLEIDLNYLYRIPLWEPKIRKSVQLGKQSADDILVLSPEELGAGKLTALFSRKASRDLFDAHYLMHQSDCDMKKLKLTFLAYGVMSGVDLRKLSLENIGFDWNELQRKLIPVLDNKLTSNRREMLSWSEKITKECRETLRDFIKLNNEEKAFLKAFHEKNIVDLELVTDDKGLVERYNKHPLLAWRKMQNAERNLEKKTLITNDPAKNGINRRQGGGRSKSIRM